MKSRRTRFILGGIVLLALAIAGYAAWQAWSQSQASLAALPSAEVKRITAVSSFDSVGTVAPLQSAALFWQTSGQVKTVQVKAGDTVKAGDVLMTLDPASAPPGVLMAQADLLNAQKALNDLLHPGPLTLASAQKAVADAQVALDKANRTLRAVQSPAGPRLNTAVSDAKLALDTANANLQLAHVSPDAAQTQAAANDKNLAFSQLQQAQTDLAACLKISCGERDQLQSALTDAQNAYQTALDAFLTAQLKYQTLTANQADAAAKAQTKYNQVVANLNAAQLGPNPDTLAVAQANVAVDEASLTEAQVKLDKLLKGPDAQEIAAATARVLAAQATIDSLHITAPFDGQVAAVNFLPGDVATSSLAAVELANRSSLYVSVLVNEADISHITVGSPVTVTVRALADLQLTGEIAQVGIRGTSVKGLVKYPVQVKLTQTDPNLLVGMTATATIVTSVQPDALAVPVEAVQTDAQGEFVNRLTPAGGVERVSVVSGTLQGSDVVVTGNLQPGDKVLLAPPPAASTGNPANLLTPANSGQNDGP